MTRFRRRFCRRSCLYPRCSRSWRWVWGHRRVHRAGESAYCRKAYSVFVGQVRNMVRHGCDMASSVRQAIQYCIDHDWLREYFKQKQEGRSTSANRASPSVRVLGTFSHTTYYPIICALGACFLDRSAGGLRYGKLHAQTSTSWTLCAALTEAWPIGLHLRLDLLGLHGKLRMESGSSFADSR